MRQLSNVVHSRQACSKLARCKVKSIHDIPPQTKHLGLKHGKVEIENVIFYDLCLHGWACRPHGADDSEATIFCFICIAALQKDQYHLFQKGEMLAKKQQGKIVLLSLIIGCYNTASTVLCTQFPAWPLTTEKKGQIHDVTLPVSSPGINACISTLVQTHRQMSLNMALYSTQSNQLVYSNTS